MLAGITVGRPGIAVLTVSLAQRDLRFLRAGSSEGRWGGGGRERREGEEGENKKYWDNKLPNN